MVNAGICEDYMTRASRVAEHGGAAHHPGQAVPASPGHGPAGPRAGFGSAIIARRWRALLVVGIVITCLGVIVASSGIYPWATSIPLGDLDDDYVRLRSGEVFSSYGHGDMITVHGVITEKDFGMGPHGHDYYVTLDRSRTAFLIDHDLEGMGDVGDMVIVECIVQEGEFATSPTTEVLRAVEVYKPMGAMAAGVALLEFGVVLTVFVHIKRRMQKTQHLLARDRV